MAEGMTWTVTDGDKLTQAEIYGEVLSQLGEKHPDLIALTADLATSTKIGRFGKKFPERFINVGIAENSLFGMAAGLAMAGLKPVVSTFAVFTSLRCAEQVRTDICYQNLNVKIIATHAGISFGQAGSTHHCTEDLAVMRSFANMTVIAPADGFETGNALVAAMDWPGPVYMRIGRGFEPPVHKDQNYPFEIGRAITMRDGKDVTLIGCGVGVLQAMRAAEVLDGQGLSARVLDMHTVKPIDREAVISAVKDTRRIVTIEDHNIYGGLGTAVAEVIVASGKACAFRKLGVPDCFSIVGYPEDLYHHYGFDADGIVATVSELMRLEIEEDEDWEDEM
ncbi:MAG TPA: transketolase family protein [Deltaproteobacteria bacterium]|jgi:transketolase|nr:transketolase family protein [Deltaproteobacteria bacterium]OQC24333.1 MAG: 1-deoxy-D-xylulose-5-phosphate synthase [Deltaproteobacteria bacterium ADurb.Bin072]HRW79922.1 transketolase family protein [Desulfomonilia bacterium]NMD39778.1 transketolase family protein [Deltaproteobacteria bacterium]HNQ86168.1 transketolase family protein [Deltaproteobacteria bacterium]